jgi:small-conductance mechanosensitive channel
MQPSAIKKFVIFIGLLEIVKAMGGALWFVMDVRWIESPYQVYLLCLCALKSVIGLGLVRHWCWARRAFVIFMGMITINGLFFLRVMEWSFIWQVVISFGMAVAIGLAMVFMTASVKKVFQT